MHCNMPPTHQQSTRSACTRRAPRILFVVDPEKSHRISYVPNYWPTNDALGDLSTSHAAFPAIPLFCHMSHNGKRNHVKVE